MQRIEVTEVESYDSFSDSKCEQQKETVRRGKYIEERTRAQREKGAKISQPKYPTLSVYFLHVLCMRVHLFFNVCHCVSPVSPSLLSPFIGEIKRTKYFKDLRIQNLNPQLLKERVAWKRGGNDENV